jgi:hypothetical protein
MPMWFFAVVPAVCGVGIFACVIALCRAAAIGDLMVRRVYDQERERRLATRTRGCDDRDRSAVR